MPKKSSSYTARHRRYRATEKGRSAAARQARRWRLKQRLLVEFAKRGDVPSCADCRLQSRQPAVFFIAPNEDVLVCHSCAVQRREEVRHG